ncbi:protein dehydratase [Bosea sp. F3-2]|uniref:FAS1-like dehydratase domain-containing protein n=1 Tax=Bosea sp. F3-2 TaxID=2599640 RepID=UPI0011EF54AD|nr:MaoC family dehydratase N-terminal domain-containing protein [Bosea sp. F3-2]QEL22875.1 protein dehydratase [Bosea sp. F3-2]
MDLDIDHLRQWIGREETATELVTRSLVQRFNATLDREGDTAPGAIAPLMLHLCLASGAVPTSRLGEDGHSARGGFLPPVPLPRRMWAGGALEFRGELRIGETMARRSVVRDVVAKSGRSGVLCFVTVEHEVTGDGKPVLSERQDIVYRADEPPRPVAVRPPAAPAGAHQRAVALSSALLFRYSALTFNSHRIHYDVPYVRDVERYPGLVVHGPLQAMLLVQFAEAIRGARPSHFSFRSLSALFDDADFSLNAAEEGQALRLWTARTGGPIAMEARTEW